MSQPDDLVKLIAEAVRVLTKLSAALGTESVTKVLERPADRRFGYRFGCDGVIGLEEALKMLGNPSRTTIDRRCDELKIRKGRDGQRVVFCIRSINEYIASLEV